MNQSGKKSFKNIVKFNNFADIDVSKIAIGASVGLFLGCIGGIFSQIAKIDFSGDVELDPPAPNMQVFFVFFYRKNLKKKRRWNQSWL